MDANKNLSIAHAWLEAFNTKNIDKLLSLYDDSAQHYSPKLKIAQPSSNGFIVGKNAMKNWWQEAFNNLPTLTYQPTSLRANNDRVFLEYIRKVDGQENLLIAEVLEIKEGKIILSRVYHG